MRGAGRAYWPAPFAKDMAKKLHKAAPRVKFMAYMREPTVGPYVPKEDLSTYPYVFHGRDNLYPEELRTLVDNCAPLERSITTLAEFIAGNGIRFYDKEGNEIEEAQDKFQEWMGDSTEEEFLFRTGYDLAHGLGLTWGVRRAAGPIVRLDHWDRMGFRAAKTVNGKIPAMYWSDDWTETMRNNAGKWTPRAIPTFDHDRADAEAILFDREYRPREPVYGRIFWLGCKAAAEVWVKVDRYNRTQLDTGFTPAVMLGTYFDGTETELDKHDELIEKAYTGSMGRGMFHFTMTSGEEPPFFQVLERANHAGELDQMRTETAEVIYDTFGIPSLLMKERKQGLTSQGDAITQRLQQFQRTVVAAKQKLITRNLVRLMNLEGVEVWEAKITPLEVFDPVQSEKILMASQTVNEAREMRGDEPLDGEEGEMLLVSVTSTGTPAADGADATDPQQDTTDTNDTQDDNPIPG